MDTPISTIMTTILVGILVLIGGTTILGSYASYNPSLDTGALSSMVTAANNSYSGMTAASNSMTFAMQTNQNDAGIFGFLDTLVNIGYGMLSALFGSLQFVTASLGVFAYVLGVPTWILGLASIFFFILLALAIASAIFRIRL